MPCIVVCHQHLIVPFIYTFLLYQRIYFLISYVESRSFSPLGTSEIRIAFKCSHFSCVISSSSIALRNSTCLVAWCKCILSPLALNASFCQRVQFVPLICFHFSNLLCCWVPSLCCSSLLPAHDFQSIESLALKSAIFQPLLFLSHACCALPWVICIFWFIVSFWQTVCLNWLLLCYWSLLQLWHLISLLWLFESLGKELLVSHFLHDSVVLTSCEIWKILKCNLYFRELVWFFCM